MFLQMHVHLGFPQMARMYRRFSLGENGKITTFRPIKMRNRTEHRMKSTSHNNNWFSAPGGLISFRRGTFGREPVKTAV
jgi:hypothetical protein